MSAPLAASRMSPPPGANYVHAQAPQAQVMTPAQAASAKVVDAYAGAILKSIYQMLAKEDQVCHAQGLTGKEVTESFIGFTDGTSHILKLRYPKLHAENSDPEIERKIGALSDANRRCLQAIAARVEALVTPQAAIDLITIQASSAGPLSKKALEATKLHQSLVFKTYVYGALLKIPDAHKTVILNGVK